MQVNATLDDFRTSAENPIPLFLEKAINFIEKEGLDAEGLYRVPGNRAHVDLLFQKFDEGKVIQIKVCRGKYKKSFAYHAPLYSIVVYRTCTSSTRVTCFWEDNTILSSQTFL